eukprot:TRINITY_DN15616_c0_g1_i4.p3 TRINITY_DN15616_c0_g1~~TRINITY_DN15616_c0_g1_i4.p3  ORF type:complete len:105 (-),score=17.05 TRINITY_DN15616_c0_g1_i4:124-438(-)
MQELQISQILFQLLDYSARLQHKTQSAFLHFYYRGKFMTKFQGSNLPQLHIEYKKLQKLVENKHPHSLLKFKNFNPEAKKNQYHSNDSQKAAMIKTINLSLIHI